MSAILGSIIRHILTIYGGAMASGGDADIGALFVKLVAGVAGGDKSTIVGTAVALVAVAWSIYEKKSKAKTMPKPSLPIDPNQPLPRK